ncbi:unnamed protein product, partial [Medioppia subpectinata]
SRPMTCYNCQETGHGSRDCTKPKVSRPRQQTNGGGGGTDEWGTSDSVKATTNGATDDFDWGGTGGDSGRQTPSAALSAETSGRRLCSNHSKRNNQSATARRNSLTSTATANGLTCLIQSKDIKTLNKLGDGSFGTH